MNDPSAPDTTQLLRAWAGGDAEALKQLTPRVYRELRGVARRLLQNERAGHSMQSADLVNEAYLRLVDINQLDWQHRVHFFAMASTLMRRVLMDRARRRMAAKRGARPIAVDLDAAIDLSPAGARVLIALDDALKAMAEVDPRRAQVVELRFFGGLSVEETAEVVKVSVDTVMRDWKVARAWLLAELTRV
jgi:RNA polymerase sigma factor (TIGR02999 family)